MATYIDLNCDLGEGLGPWTLGEPGTDDALLRLVTSANVACGFHAGDPAIMAATCATAARRGVAVGAHVGYRDLTGFGRRALDVPGEVLRAEVAYQVGALVGVARTVGARVRYVKPHGALYHRIVRDEEQAAAVVAGVLAVDPTLALVGLPGSAVLRLAAEAGLRTVVEAFVDRGYRADGSLVPRGEPGALVTDPAEAGRRAVSMVRDGWVVAGAAPIGAAGGASTGAPGAGPTGAAGAASAGALGALSTGTTGAVPTGARDGASAGLPAGAPDGRTTGAPDGRTTGAREDDGGAGARVLVSADSLCVHSDTPGAVAVARAVRAALTEAGVELRPAVA